MGEMRKTNFGFRSPPLKTERQSKSVGGFSRRTIASIFQWGGRKVRHELEGHEGKETFNMASIKFLEKGSSTKDSV